MERLVHYLEGKDAEFEILKHSKTIKTAQEGADYFGVEIGQTAPTLIFKTDIGNYALIIAGDYGRVDLTSLKDLLHVQEVRLANPKEVEQITGSSIGSVSLINPEIPTIIDREIYRFPYIYGGTGKPQTTLKIQPKDVERLNNVIEYIR